MARAVIGVVVGYLVMFVLIFATFSAAYLSMGADKAFQPGNYEVSTLWLIVSFTLGFIAAVIGGIVCARISKSVKAPLVLAGLAFVLGLIFAVPVIMQSAEGEAKVRTADVSNLQAMEHAKQPVWVALVNPFLGAFGLLAGARLFGGQTPPRTDF